MFSEIQNPSKCSSGHLECSLHNAAGKRSSKIWKISIRIQNFWNMFLIFGVNHLKKFLRITKCSFNKPPVSFPPEVKKNIIQKPKMIKKNWSKFWKRLRKNTNCSLENPAKSFLSKFFCRKFSAKIQKPSLEFLKLSKTQSYLKKICLF